MQCGYRETLVPTRDLATKQGQGNIFFHDQLTDTEHDLCTSDAHYFRIGSFRRRRAKFPNRRIGLHSLLNSAKQLQYTRSWFYLIRAYAIFDLVVQTIFRVNRRARSYLYRCKKSKLWCKLSDTKKVSSYMISHIDIPFHRYTSIIQKYWYFFKSSF